MRQRRVTGIEERLAPYADLILRGIEAVPSTNRSFQSSRVGPLPADIAAYPLRWHERPSPRYAFPEGYGRVYAELGCGRGRFINGMAAEDPGALYVGAEGCKTILVRALAGTREAGLQNVRYIDGFINDAASAFAESSLDGIFLNFSDPWPKVRHAGRRLTAPAKAEAYSKALRPGGFIVLKTDGEGFFDYSLAVLEGVGFHIAYQTRDLQGRDGLACLDPVGVGGDAGSFCVDYDIDVVADAAAECVVKSGKGPDPSLQTMCKGKKSASSTDYVIEVSTNGLKRNGSLQCPVARRGAGMETEYEQKFRAAGLPIYCLIAIVL